MKTIARSHWFDCSKTRDIDAGSLLYRLQQFQQIIRQWCSELPPLACGGMGEAQLVSVEEVALQLWVLASVDGVANQGVADVGEMDTYLVSAPGAWACLEQ